MGLFGFGKKANKNVPVLTADEVRTRLLGLNRETAPYQIIDGAAENVDLIAEWKIVDAKWFQLFGKANITKVCRIFIKFDAEKNEVHTKDEQYEVEWHSGVPMSISKFHGRMTPVEFGETYAYIEELKPGVVYNYHFSTNEIKQQIQEAVTASGWNYKGVAFGKL